MKDMLERLTKKELNNLELKLIEKRNQFIRKFRLNSKKEIEEYLSIKDI